MATTASACCRIVKVGQRLVLSQGHRGVEIPIAALHFAGNRIQKRGIPFPLFSLSLLPCSVNL
jgi:hypothetical protein